MRLWDSKGLVVARNWVSNCLLRIRDSVLLFYRHFNQINTVFRSKILFCRTHFYVQLSTPVKH